MDRLDKHESKPADTFSTEGAMAANFSFRYSCQYQTLVWNVYLTSTQIAAG